VELVRIRRDCRKLIVKPVFPIPVTLTPAVALPKPVALAVIVADPEDTPVTGTATLVAPTPKVTVDGTEATPGLLEVKVTVTPLATVDANSVNVCVTAPLRDMLDGEKLRVFTGAAAPTCTTVLTVG
jgi:hypothetical protein